MLNWLIERIFCKSIFLGREMHFRKCRNSLIFNHRLSTIGNVHVYWTDQYRILCVLYIIHCNCLLFPVTVYFSNSFLCEESCSDMSGNSWTERCYLTCHNIYCYCTRHLPWREMMSLKSPRSWKIIPRKIVYSLVTIITLARTLFEYNSC